MGLDGSDDTSTRLAVLELRSMREIYFRNLGPEVRVYGTMKRTLLLSIATLAFSGLLAAPAFAQNPNTQGAGPGKYDPNHPRVNQVNNREQKQQNRIANGMKSGAVTPKEGVKLEKQQQHIVRQEKRDMAEHNGHLTKADQAQLNREQNRASANIYAKKHNDAVR